MPRRRQNEATHGTIPGNDGSHEVNVCVVSGSRGQPAIASQQRRGKGFGQGNVGCVVRREVMTQLPDPGQQEIMRVTGQWPVGEVFKRFEPSRWSDGAGQGVATKDLCDLDIDQMRRVKRLVLSEKPPAN